jgi:predicted O-linked N-acetylglucosamine transferase (SPINDLY family)
MPQLHLNLGNTYKKCGRFDEAIDSYKLAIALKPDYTRAQLNLAVALKSAGRLDESRIELQRLLELQPRHIGARRNLIKAAIAVCDFDAIDEHRRKLTDHIEPWLRSTRHYEILVNIAYDHLFYPLPQPLYRALTESIARVLAENFRPLSLPARVRTPNRQLHIGYVSPNFGNHPVGHVTRSLFASHDREAFRISGYATKNRSREAADFHSVIRSGFDNFVDMEGLNPSRAANRIAADGIDILIDIDGYMDLTSPPIMAHRPAPIQVFWLGHAGGLGLPFIDYMIADSVVVPDTEEDMYTESVIRLPEVYHPSDRYPVPEGTPSRSEQGLAEDAIVFCAFNNPEKVDRRIFECWMRILRAVPNSQIWLTDSRKHGDPRPNLRALAQERGVDSSRLVFAKRVPDKGAHLARHRLADLFLDTLTVNAATTTLDALWAGLPVLTCTGDRFASRMATSFLTAIDMPELICATLAEYEDRAVALGSDPVAREGLRAKLEANRTSTPLFDICRFTHHLEDAYREMWRRFRAGEPTAGFNVPARERQREPLDALVEA